MEISLFSKKIGVGAGFQLGHLKRKARIFHAAEAHLAPAGDGPILDIACFDGIGGLQFGFEGSEERVEGGALVIENDGAGEDPMTAAVLGGSTRMGAVGAKGLDTTFRTHSIQLWCRTFLVSVNGADNSLKTGKFEVLKRRERPFQRRKQKRRAGE